LTRQCHGNVHAQGIVDISADSSFDSSPYHAAWNAADLVANSTFCSKNAPDQSLTYDFRDRHVTLSHYSIRSHFAGTLNDYHLRSWVVEGSSDGETWSELDRREDDASLKGGNLTQVFEVRSPGLECRLVRLRQIGPNHFLELDYRLVVSGFELFGLITE
jgi:hypothetical protein